MAGEVEQQARDCPRVDQRSAGVSGVREAREQQQDVRLRGPGLRVVWVVVGLGRSGY